MASINDNNVQGAVLWGVRSNSSVHGRVCLHHLVVSKPGPVDLKISVYNGNGGMAAGQAGYGKAVPQTTPLYLTKMTVLENEEMKHTSKCTFVFTDGQCPRATSLTEVEQWQSGGTTVHGMVSSSLLYEALGCSALWDTWHVKSHVLATSGQVWFQYRNGINAIWTGLDLPREEMSAYQRLAIPESASAREVRRAYYRQSLVWHPDRWAGLSLYALAVQGAFELVADAYRQLQLQLGEEEAQ